MKKLLSSQRNAPNLLTYLTCRLEKISQTVSDWSHEEKWKEFKMESSKQATNWSCVRKKCIYESTWTPHIVILIAPTIQSMEHIIEDCLLRKFNRTELKACIWTSDVFQYSNLVKLGLWQRLPPCFSSINFTHSHFFYQNHCIWIRRWCLLPFVLQTFSFSFQRIYGIEFIDF